MEDTCPVCNSDMFDKNGMCIFCSYIKEEDIVFRPTVVFDFDGVVHEYKSPWKGPSVISDGPVEGMREALIEIRKEYEVVIVSTRCSCVDGMNAIINWLALYDIVVDKVLAEKPPAIAYVDDRAICFDGNPKALLHKLRTFVPWNKGEQANVLLEALNMIAEGTGPADVIANDVLKMTGYSDMKTMTKKDSLLRKTPKKVLVVAIQRPDGCIETITNTEKLWEKMLYYAEAYDDNLYLKANPKIRIIDWMVI